jgi:hypothetical protein
MKTEHGKSKGQHQGADVLWGTILTTYRERLSTLRIEIEARQGEATRIEAALPHLEQLVALSDGNGHQNATIAPGSTQRGRGDQRAVLDSTKRRARAGLGKDPVFQDHAPRVRPETSSQNDITRAEPRTMRAGKGGGDSKVTRIMRALRDLGSGSIEAIATQAGLPANRVGIILASCAQRGQWFRRVGPGMYAVRDAEEIPKAPTENRDGARPERERHTHVPADQRITEVLDLLRTLQPGDAPGMTVGLIASRLGWTKAAAKCLLQKEAIGQKRIVRVAPGLFGLPT